MFARRHSLPPLRAARWIAVLLSCAALAACGGDEGNGDDDTDVAPTDTGDDMAGPACDIDPTLSSLRMEYFEKSCTFGGCHDAASAKAELDLSSTNSTLHSDLVGQPANDEFAFNRGKLLVVAGDSANSFLYQKVADLFERDEGDLMPQGSPNVVDPDCRVAMLKAWIDAGASDN